jgi:hypothetical protein
MKGEDLFDVKMFCIFLCRILKGADALQLEKPIKQEFGGGFQIFLFDELEFYEGKNERFCMKIYFVFRCTR